MERRDTVGPRENVILIDTNVFVIDLRYQRDCCFGVNREFIARISTTQKAFTTLVNLLEICGILSFNLNDRQLEELWYYFERRFGVRVLPPPLLDGLLPAAKISAVFDLMKRRASFGDAQMIAVAEQHLSFVSTLISWDKEHLTKLFRGTVMTPEEYLDAL